MNVFLLLQFALWFLGTIAGAVAIVQYFAFRKKEARLPEACSWDDLTARLDQTREALGQLNQEAAAARQVIGESQQQLARAAEARQWFDNQRSELTRIEGERKQQELLRASIAALLEEKRSLEAALSRVQHEQAAESANLTNLATQRANLAAEIQAAKEQGDSLEKEIQDKKLQLGLITNELNLKTVDHDRLKQLLETTNELQERAKAKLEATVAEIDTAKRTLVEVQTQRHALEQECHRLKSEIDSLNKWKESLTALLQTLQANINRLDPQKRDENRYRDLWAPISFPNLAPAPAAIPEKEALANTSRYLRSHGLYYPTRVVHAFHAALKTADMSPLVVLAGISGTGKSLLPKRYAEAMGIHMVSVAVQPRWDSPQDLFGFFNHLEHRFKATDLARAMVMFERFNRGDWDLPAGWRHGREDRMLLVLLDEMNLARVEYYFSDFLSKLETRRDVKESDPFDRAKAEISLDMGSLRDGEQPIRIYPGKNILFAGTMNEDESTQSLSDKVIDRACVLRFGRPRKLERSAAQYSPEAPTPKGLRFDVWAKWSENSLSPSEASTLNGWITKLNAGMDAVGKPFAHRVHQAIHSYAANYPLRNGEDGLRLALADQIEQRILPKLRGLEIEDNGPGFEAIEKVVNETRDPALSAAFRQGMDSKSGTFLWRGLDRGEE
jgi:hypothetical protein